MDAKHTPGPWEYDGFSVVTKAPVERGRTYGYGCGDDHVANLNDGEYHEFRSRDEQDATGRLIAAAPELLEQLRITVARCRACIIHSGTDAEYADIALSTATAAIAKATGQ